MPDGKPVSIFPGIAPTKPIHTGAEDVDDQLPGGVEGALVQAATADILARVQRDFEHDIVSTRNLERADPLPLLYGRGHRP